MQITFKCAYNLSGNLCHSSVRDILILFLSFYSFYWKNYEISRWKSYINTCKLKWNFSIITDIFLRQKRVNVWEHTLKMALLCSHIFTLFWSRKTSVIIKTFQLNFHVFKWTFHPEIYSIFGKSFPFLFLFLCYPYFSTFLSMWSLLFLFLC